MNSETWTTQHRRERIDRFVAWLMAKELKALEEGEPRTQAELAAELGVSAHTLSDYKKDPYFKSQYRKASMDRGRAVEVRELVLGAMIEILDSPKASPGAKVNASRVLLALTEGVLSKASDDPEDVPDTVEGLDDELDDLLGLRLGASDVIAAEG